jgi:hypothetical protein
MKCVELGELAGKLETLDFDALFASISASNNNNGYSDIAGPDGPDGLDDLRSVSPSGARTEALDGFVGAVEAAFEVAFADFVERTSEQTHRTLELAVSLLSSVAPERGATARERVDLANAVKNASVILFGPITQAAE